VLTREGADDAEIIIRPSSNGGWQIEMPSGDGVTVTIVGDELTAIALAHELRPDAQIRVLPAAECFQTLRDDPSPNSN
jgi:hypothetical protein